MDRPAPSRPARHKFRLTFQRDTPAMRPDMLHPHVGAEMAQHALGVIARRLGLDHHRLARRREPREQDRGFELCGGSRRLVDDRDRIACTGQAQRQPPALGNAERRGRPSAPGGQARAFIGRERNEASPSNVAAMGQPATAPMTKRQPVPEFPEIEGR